ncbi:hypothetical protein [Kibdelosporangium aridum]|uniref:hypothetical protein n=1 Tax=Kibdelosporangium aridum TaxID=2030 RepID=UPI000A059E3B|nr:hypothetical protein [Kibdelosporangium aridum]
MSAIAPQARGNDTTRVTVPEQHGQDQIRDGMQLTAVFYGGNPVLLELSSGTVLETDQHPRRSTLTSGYLAIGLLGMGVFAVQVGWRNGRWRSSVPTSTGPVQTSQPDHSFRRRFSKNNRRLGALHMGPLSQALSGRVGTATPVHGG